MPGTKIDLKTGDDPNPAPYLFVSAELKQKIAEKVYDPKRSCYVPHPEEKFCEGIVEETNGNKVKVKIVAGESKGDVEEYEQDLVAQVNPPKGFPDSVLYADFRSRYVILAPKEAVKAMKKVSRPVTEEKKNIAASHAVMDKIQMSLEKFQYGHTKVFFRAGKNIFLGFLHLSYFHGRYPWSYGGNSR